MRNLIRLLGAFGLAFAVASPAWASTYLFPASPYAPGHLLKLDQWCDRPEDLQAVVDLHSKFGRAVAAARYKELIQADLCHKLPPQLPTTGVLLEQVGFAYVKIEAAENNGVESRAVIEVWAVLVDGIPDRPVFATLAWLHPVSSGEGPI